MDLSKLLEMGNEDSIEFQLEKELKVVDPSQENNAEPEKVNSEVNVTKNVENKVASNKEETNIDSTNTDVDNKSNETVKYDKDVLNFLPDEDEYLKDLDYGWEIKDGNVYTVRKRDGKLLETRNRYFYVSPKLLRSIGFEIIEVSTSLGGGSFTIVAEKDGDKVVVYDSITGYYPGFIVISNNTIKIKHTKSAIESIIEILSGKVEGENENEA